MAALLTAAAVAAGCGEDDQVSFQDQQRCLNAAEREYERMFAGDGAVSFFGTDAYLAASDDCRDGRFTGFPDSALLEERDAAEREAQRQRQQQEDQEQAERENAERDRREAELDREWDRLDCGGRRELSPSVEARCDELSQSP